MSDIDLYQEEQRQILLDTKTEIAELTSLIRALNKSYVAPKDEVAVKGELTVNTEKEVAVSNLDGVLSGLEALGSKVTKAIAESQPEPIKNVAVSNIGEAKSDKVAVTNLDELTKELTSVKQAINELDLVVNVDKQELKLPYKATDAVPVRLSDGSKFYKALETMVASVGGGASYVAIDEEGVVQPLRIDQSGALYITGAITAQSSTLADFAVNDIDDTTSTEYYGFTKPDATWQVKKIVSSGVSYATVTNNGGVADYATAWTNKATLTYGRFDEAF